MTDNYYEELGVEPGASRDELREAHRQRVSELEAAREKKGVTESQLQANREEVARVRAAAQVPGEARVVGFFGQALHALAGYRRTIEGFVDAVRGLSAPARVLLRPHPREDARQHAETEAIFRQSGIDALLADAGPVEDALAACDVVVSLFSTCTYDTAYLNRFSAEPVAGLKTSAKRPDVPGTGLPPTKLVSSVIWCSSDLESMHP